MCMSAETGHGCRTCVVTRSLLRDGHWNSVDRQDSLVPWSGSKKTAGKVGQAGDVDVVV